MKYMGSKRIMLTNGLGTLIKNEASNHKRVVDLFCGAASVSWFAAQNTERPVLACDLQSYSTVLASAVLSRMEPIDDNSLIQQWLGDVESGRARLSTWKAALELDLARWNTVTWAKRSRSLCETEVANCIIWNRYGGYYFSPTQALTFDAMLKALPDKEPLRSVCLAATIIVASQCAASPGHTAQPFRATRTAGPFLREAWQRDPLEFAKKALQKLCPQHSYLLGEIRIGDAVEIASSLKDTDVVFVDPPYSDVHYSRFYHVLETIARGDCGKVSGAGRYPPPEERPFSAFSRKTESQAAFSLLLSNLSKSGCTVILTFPADKCSNGLSGAMVLEEAGRYFKIKERQVKTRFSTLGGNNTHRVARQLSNEMILLLRPY